MYRHNVFRAVNRNPRITYHLHESFIISPKFLPLFRNLIIECPQDNCGLEWYNNASVALEKLVAAKAPLQSLTLVLVPKRVSKIKTAVGMEASPVTFADFFWIRGRFMKALRDLSCKKFNVVVKKPSFVSTPAITLRTPDVVANVISTAAMNEDAEGIAGEGEAVKVDKVLEPSDIATVVKRFLISLDLTYLPAGVTEKGYLANEVTVRIFLFQITILVSCATDFSQIKQRREHRMNLGKQFTRLKSNFEAIYEDPEKAVADGLCRMMEYHEKIYDVVKLSEA